MMKYTTKTMINFFDFGTHRGQEIDCVIKNLAKANILYRIFSFEANPELHKKLQKKYKSNDNVVLYNLAIASVTGKLLLYKSNRKDADGSSLYKDKRNVTEEGAVEVCTIKFSSWLALNNINLNGPVNVLKANIEGAEYDLFIDLEKNDLLKHFHLFICSNKDHGFSRDMVKIKSLVPKVKELNQLMKRNNIQQEGYHELFPELFPYTNFLKRVKEILKN